ncbi:MAG: hypothetical protein QM831_33250 [Kofleriaceae bacterium]
MMQTEAVQVLVQLDFSRHQARSMVERAMVTIPVDRMRLSSSLPRFDSR